MMARYLLKLIRKYIKIKRRLTLLFMVLSCLFIQFDSLNISPVNKLVLEYRFDVTGWEFKNIFDKWLYKAQLGLDSSSLSRHERLKIVDDYMALNFEERRLIPASKSSYYETDELASEKLVNDERLDYIRLEQLSIRHVVEDVLEDEVGNVLSEQELPIRIPLVNISFPPVDFRLDEMPHILITSPRDEINRKESILLEPSLSRLDMQDIENEIFATQNLSALVENVGGLSTYPALISNSHNLRFILNTAAHEWLHQFFFFHPIGQNFSSSADMAILNETAANLIGSEVGALAMDEILLILPSIGNHHVNTRKEVHDNNQFNFREEMRETRLQVDQLLESGDIQGAERYMEERRLFMADNGVYIRKLNQAYFAFHGRYGDSPSSASSIADELKEVRKLMPSLKSFVNAISAVSSYQEFKDLRNNLLAQDK